MLAKYKYRQQHNKLKKKKTYFFIKDINVCTSLIKFSLERSTATFYYFFLT